MVITINFQTESMKNDFIKLLDDSDSDIVYTIQEEMSAIGGQDIILVKAAEDEYEVIKDAQQ